MQADEAKRRARAFARGLRRWDRWLRDRLAPAMVGLAEFPERGGGGCRWTVEPPFGATSTIRIPGSLIEVGPEDFHRATVGLGTFAWEIALERWGSPGLRLLCADDPDPDGSDRHAAA
ncbi:MAG: hypothetical protein ACOC8K_00700 [Gemmatimonadota bacterium]